MCYRIFNKPDKSHDWIKAAEFQSLQEALTYMETLTQKHSKRPGQWVLRNVRGEVVSRVTVSVAPSPCTFWTPSQVMLCS